MLTGLALFKKAEIEVYGRGSNDFIIDFGQKSTRWIFTSKYAQSIKRQIGFYLHHNLLLFFNFMATSSHVTSYHWLNNIKLKKEHGSNLFNIHKSDIFKNEFRGENGTANIIFKQTKCICNKSTPRILTLNITDTLNFNDTKFCVAMVYYTFRKN